MQVTNIFCLRDEFDLYPSLIFSDETIYGQTLFTSQPNTD